MWVGFGDIWRMLVNVGEYLMKKVHRYKSKFGWICSFYLWISIIYLRISKNNGHFVYKFGYLCNKIND